jgi:hypothetical protein
MMPVFIAFVLPAALAAVPAQQPQQPRIDITITVTAEDARRADEAIRTIERADDPFLGYLADHVVALAGAMTSTPANPKVYTVGPLTAREQQLVPVDDYLIKHQQVGGNILVRFRRSWTESDFAVFQFTQASFLTMLADAARGPTLRVPAIQRERQLWVGRTIVDLNRQAGGVIADRHIFSALAAGFKDKAAGGRIGEIVGAMADSGARFDLVPRDRLQEFRERAEPGFIVPVAAGQPNAIRLDYDGRQYTTSADALTWSFLRLFAGDNSADWAMRAAAGRRSALGRAVLSYLESQARLAALNAILEKLPALGTGGDLALGAYRPKSPAALALADAPGLARKDGPNETVVLSVRASKAAEFRAWLASARAALQDEIER